MGALGVLAPAALQLVALRAENMGGDLRVAMTMCREPLLRAFMAFARTHALPPLPLAVAQVAPVVAELVDDTRALISGLTALQKQFLAALFAAAADAADTLLVPGVSGSSVLPTSPIATTNCPHGTPPCSTTSGTTATATATTNTTKTENNNTTLSTEELEMQLRQHRLAPASKGAVYARYCDLCAALGAQQRGLSMLVLFRECVGALADLNFVRAVGTDALDLAVDADDLLAALRTTDPLVHRALLSHFAPPPSTSASAAAVVVDTDADATATFYAVF